MKMAKSETIIRVAVALLLAGSVAAQSTNTDATTAAQQTTAAANTNQQTTTNQPAATTAAGTNTNPGIVVTGVPTAVTTSSSTTANRASSAGGLSDLPTIAGYGIPTMVIPDTKGAPYMVTSTLPEGTIFICVGAFLAFMGVAVLAWRGLVAWSIHRSVKRVNEKLQHQSDLKSVKPGYGGAASLANQSNMSMDHVGLTGGGTLPKKNHNNTPTRSNIASNQAAARSSSLFFSPTAGHGNNSSTYLPGNRSSSFLPSGYYAPPGAGSPAQGASYTHVGSGAPQRNSRFSRYHDNSPPGSPGLPPSSRGMDSVRNGNHGMYYQPSTSSLNLNMPGMAHPGGRAPSANMDDMFDHQAPNAR